jgi:hypothetical protein
MQNGTSHLQSASLPTSDPGNNGGGSYTGTTSAPSKEDFEDLFGPAGREVNTDPQRHKRHQRWHLPDVLKGSNSFLTDRVDGLMTNATDSPFTSMILPYIRVDNPDQALTWDVWSYDEGLASRVPYESAARVLTQSKTSHSAYIVRQGLAISMEHNFMMSERGRRDFNNQLMQLVGSIQYTNDLDVHMALITAPNYERTEIEKYAYSDSDPYSVLRKYVDMYGMCQKNPNGLDVLIEDAKQVFKKWGASEPTFMLCNPKIGYQQNMTVEKTQYITNGIDGVKRLKSGPDLKSYRGLNVVHSRHFSMEAGRQPRDLLNRRVRVAEHYKLPPMTPIEMDECSVLLYDEGRDQMVPIECRDLYEASRLPKAKGEPEDQTFEELLKLHKDQQLINHHFWNHLYYKPSDPNQSEEQAKVLFENWLKAAPNEDDPEVMYHPSFVTKMLAYLQNKPTGPWIFADVMAAAAVSFVTGKGLVSDTVYIAGMRGMFPKSMDQNGANNMAIWLTYMKRARVQGQASCTKYGECHNAHRSTFANTAKTVNGMDKAAFIAFYSHGMEMPNNGSSQFPGALNSLEIDYGQFLPYVANVYSRCHDQARLFSSNSATGEVKKYSLVAVRPSIEHHMLGVIVGRGGTAELGATLWGQTELSCYDDAMHGKWGMNYKYHARAVVFNEKHLLRLWDIAFNGYNGGMGTKVLSFNDEDDVNNWKQSSHSLDEQLRHDTKDIFVMRFDANDNNFDGVISNPIGFHAKDASGKKAYADAENMHCTHLECMDVFENFRLDSNNERYKRYHTLMPNFTAMHSGRKHAGHASTEGDTHVASLSFSGTMQLKNNRSNQVVLEQRGTGHCGDSYVGSASIRSGNGSMAMGRPAPYRLV